MKQLAWVLMLAMALVVAGCGEDKTADPRKTTGPVDAGTPGTHVDPETEAKTTSGRDAKIPASFPRDVYIYSPSEVEQAGEARGESWALRLKTNDSADKIWAAYSSKMTASGWSEDKMGTARRSKTRRYTKGGLSCIVQVLGANGGSLIKVAVGKLD